MTLNVTLCIIIVLWFTYDVHLSYFSDVYIKNLKLRFVGRPIILFYLLTTLVFSILFDLMVMISISL
jgi:hypothetical protein